MSWLREPYLDDVMQLDEHLFFNDFNPLISHDISLSYNDVSCPVSNSCNFICDCHVSSKVSLQRGMIGPKVRGGKYTTRNRGEGSKQTKQKSH